MRLTPALYVRNLLAKLHPPLPTNPRESQQLLRVLEGSFRKHLDDIHPSPAQRQPLQVSQSDIPLKSLDPQSNATLHYLDTVLNNPLLARKNETARPSVNVSTHALRVFAQAVLEGNVALPLLQRCLSEYLQGLKKGDQVDEKERLSVKLASWLYTASPRSKEAFLSSIDVLSVGVQVAEADRQEAVAWDWLRMVYERSFGSDEAAHSPALSDLKWLSIEDNLVSYIMRLAIRRGELNDAAQQFVEAGQYRLDSGRAAASLRDATDGMRYIPLVHSWKRLAAAIAFYRARHGILVSIFDRAIQYSTPWASAPHFSMPFMMIYHPTSPSARSLHQHLSNAELSGQFLSIQIKSSRKFRKIILLNILDGAQLSLDQGLREQAQFLLSFARTHYSEFLPALTQEATPNLDTQIRTAQVELEAQSYRFVLT